MCERASDHIGNLRQEKGVGYPAMRLSDSKVSSNAGEEQGKRRGRGREGIQRGVRVSLEWLFCNIFIESASDIDTASADLAR